MNVYSLEVEVEPMATGPPPRPPPQLCKFFHLKRGKEAKYAIYGI